MICPVCRGKGEITDGPEDLEPHLQYWVPKKPCPMDGCHNGHIASSDAPNDGLPKVRIEEGKDDG